MEKLNLHGQKILDHWDLEKNIMALEANMSAKFTFLPRLENKSCVSDGPITIINSGRKTDMFNIICRTKTSKPSELKAAMNVFSNQGLPFAWWVGFQQEPADLNEHLELLGLTRTESELGMAILLADLPKKEINPKLEIKCVDNKSCLEDFIGIIMKLVSKDALQIQDFYNSNSDFILNNIDKLRLFVGYIEQQPVSTSALYCDYGVAGIWDIITLPEARGQGIGTDMTLAALREGERQGFKVGVLTASDEGQSVYRKLGFDSVRQYYIYNLIA